MRVPAWQYRRTRFNHDWLKNQYIPALGRLQNLMNGQIEDFDSEAVFMEQILSEWRAHREEALSLPRDFEEGMSPRRLFDCPPLSYSDAETVGPHGDLIHCLWMARHPVRRWIAEASARAIEADEAYRQLHEALLADTDLPPQQSSVPFQTLGTNFYGACCKLAKAIEQFPNRVYVT